MKALFDQPQRYFSGYLILASILLLLNGSVWAVFYIGLVFIALVLGTRVRKMDSWKNTAHLCLFLAITMNITYFTMGIVVPGIHNKSYDSTLLSLDRILLSLTPSQLFQNFIDPFFTDIMSFCYILFMPLLTIHLLRYFFYQRTLLNSFYTGLFMIYGIGFIGYFLVPANGPWVAFEELYNKDLGGGFMAALNQKMVVNGSNRVDVFPSLHTGVSLFILGFSWRHHKNQFWILLLPVTGLWVSTLYLRYHYLVDVVLGFLLGAFALKESFRNFNKNFKL